MVSLYITKPRVVKSLGCIEPLSCILINKASNEVFRSFRDVIPGWLVKHKTTL